MNTSDFLIIGGGMTAAAAVDGIREADPRGLITIISAEDQPPYNRPPLTKKLWKGKPESGIFRQLPTENLEVRLNRRVVKVDPLHKMVEDEGGEKYSYRRLLFATGGRPRRLPDAPDEIIYLRTLKDYQEIRSWTGKGLVTGIIGGGFIGSEIAASLASIGEKVLMVFPEDGIGARIFPKELSRFVTGYYQEKGVDVRTGVEISSIAKNGDSFVMGTSTGTALQVDRLIAGIGLLPNTDLAEAAGVKLAGVEGGRGVRVDEHLRTNLPDIFAAGDVASFHTSALRREMRVEHEDNANTMGRIAGLNMAGEETVYDYLPYFYSDLFDLGYEAIGELDPKLEVVEDWKELNRKGVLYYMKDQRVVGVLLWNTWDQIDPARGLIASGQVFQKEDLLGRLGN